MNILVIHSLLHICKFLKGRFIEIVGLSCSVPAYLALLDDAVLFSKVTLAVHVTTNAVSAPAAL